MESELLAHLTAYEKHTLMVVCILLPSLLFTNDIVLLATQQLIVQRILDTLTKFYT